MQYARAGEGLPLDHPRFSIVHSLQPLRVPGTYQGAQVTGFLEKGCPSEVLIGIWRGGLNGRLKNCTFGLRWLLILLLELPCLCVGP